MSESEITALVRRYIDAFNAEDFAEAFTCYRMPFTWLFGQKSVTVSSRDEFISTMQKTKAALGRDGLGQSNLVDTKVRMFTDNIAMVQVTVTRQREDGTEISRNGGTYIVQNDGNGWRFIVNVTHPVDQVE